MTTQRTIRRFSGNYAFLSNFYRSRIYIPAGPLRGVWMTAEHIFQASKAVDIEDIDRIKLAHTPQLAKRLGRKIELRPDWEEIKIDSMRNVLAFKFPLYKDTRDMKLSEWLMDTHPHILIEGNTWGDRFWGQVAGQGQNHLGLLLMERRDQLREELR